MTAPTQPPKRPMGRAILRSALSLGLFAIVTAGVVAGTRTLTFDRIADNRQASQYRVLKEVLPEALRDVPIEALLDNAVMLPASEAMGQHQPFRGWRVKRGDNAALLMPVVATGGYNGDIHLLVGVDQDGRVSGVRVTRHQETPGLGDKIERRKSDWITDFNGRSLEDPAPEGWEVTKDGGEFDAFTGATITPRAVVRAVKRSLEYVEAEGDSLFQADQEDQP
ncbi:electron transport complex subunit G [Litchfieldella qijiaojingensis]|uniref:Ion-translocating oxidoreductase complex subunit G n=1 Tax=Litchfieldella qijiaojingensis TaxID=980347 RepID=A0ABQ2Z7A7_9GAMM|nr:electron transport complex subunit RsxG [Halomonas qijiaojingensis]GGY06965.1 electron transport complex subunit G [Halomonas qijiaojingensis]